MRHEEGRPAAASSTSNFARDGSSRRRPTLVDLGRADIDSLATALGTAYPGGPFPCLNPRCGAGQRDPLAPVRAATFVQSPKLARCFECGADFTVWRMRTAVLGDARLARRLARVLEVVV
jgi:hypothetical protein